MIILRNNKIFEWAGFQVWEFLHPRAGWKNLQKLAYGPWEARFYFPRANFKSFFNQRDEQISISETHPPFGNQIYTWPIRKSDFWSLQAVSSYEKRSYLTSAGVSLKIFKFRHSPFLISSSLNAGRFLDVS